jgi:hypothetical protein
MLLSHRSVSSRVVLLQRVRRRSAPQRRTGPRRLFHACEPGLRAVYLMQALCPASLVLTADRRAMRVP